MGRLTTVVEQIVIPHQAFADAHQQIEQAFKYAQDKGAAEGLAVIGESGTGKTSVLEAVRSEHESHRDSDGLKVPILFATVPSGPTKKGLASVLLAAMHDPDPDRGTVFELERRLKNHMEQAGTSMIMIDEFQHFYDRGKHKIMHEVADWLKRSSGITQKRP
jgi:Cdc6-like AAA superfamily ATPase